MPLPPDPKPNSDPKLDPSPSPNPIPNSNPNSNPNPNPNQVQRAYKLLAMQHHPDRGGSEERFKDLSRAYKRLSSEGDSGAEYAEAEEHDELSGWRTIKMPFTAFRDFRFHEFSETVAHILILLLTLTLTPTLALALALTLARALALALAPALALTLTLTTQGGAARHRHPVHDSLPREPGLHLREGQGGPAGPAGLWGHQVLLQAHRRHRAAPRADVHVVEAEGGARLFGTQLLLLAEG